MIFEAFIGGWIHREAYGGKYLLDFKEVSDKLMIKFGKLCSGASASATGTWSEANGGKAKLFPTAKSLRIRVTKTTSTSPKGARTKWSAYGVDSSSADLGS